MKRLDLKGLLKTAGSDQLREVADAWLTGDPAGDRGRGADGDHAAAGANGDGSGDANGSGERAKLSGRSKTALVADVAAAMEDERRVLARLEALPRRLADLLEPFFAAPGTALQVPELFQSLARNFKSRFDLEACLAALQREGFLFPATDKRWSGYDGPGYALPGELARCVADHRRRTRRALKDVLTLQGFLDARYFRKRSEAQGKEVAQNGKGSNGSDHARKIYKIYALDSAIAQRRGKLPESVARAVGVSLLRHGGMSSWEDLQQELDDDEMPDLELTRKCLEDGMLGTVGPLELARFGIQPVEQGMIVFHEVAMAELRRHAAATPVAVEETLSCGGNMATNVCRFLRELSQSKVLFTAEGELFKASSKRIAGLLLPTPGPFLPAEAQLELLYRFCLHRRLIDRRGERALRPTPQGQEFDRATLQAQVKLLLLHFVEDRSMSGEAFHQVRLRRVLLRLLRRGEPLVWHELGFLPFLARNAYLAQLDGEQAEEFFAARFTGGGYTPTESLQQMCWNLLLWVKRRLYPLGLVDIGFSGGRPVAMRLSQLGTELLDAEPAAKVGGTRSSLIVNPDFEIVLFPGDDEHAAVHLLDRFSKRIKSDHVHQFRLSAESVRAGVAEGLSVEQIVRELQDRARAPLPQNVIYSLEEWGA